MKSKIVVTSMVIVVLILGVGVIGYFLGFRNAQKPQVAGVTSKTDSQVESTREATLEVSQSTSSGQISESEQLVNSFYRFYINCLNQKGDCSYNNRPDLDYTQLTEKTRDVQGIDRLLCAQNIPKIFRIDHSTKDSETLESVYLIEEFEKDQVQLIVEVQKTTSGPKIVNVICPRP